MHPGDSKAIMFFINFISSLLEGDEKFSDYNEITNFVATNK